MTENEAITALVDHVAKKAVAETTPFEESIDALNAVTRYLTVVLKQKEPEPPEEEAGPSFATFRGDLERAEERGNGAAARLASGDHRGNRSGRSSS